MKNGYFLIFMLIINSLVAQKSNIPFDYQLIYNQDFTTPQALLDFDMTDNSAWRVNKEIGSLELYGKSNYLARVRSPFNIALLKPITLGDFILEVKLAQSGKEYGHRDLCLFFNVQDPTNYYYTHIASVADDHANNIFLVNDAPRIKIATKTTAGTNWGATNSWHTVRIERNTKAGTIKVYFDNMNQPIMEATDTHFIKGHIGFGSFDDTGHFDDIKIWAPMEIKGSADFFKEANIKH